MTQHTGPVSTETVATVATILALVASTIFLVLFKVRRRSKSGIVKGSALSGVILAFLVLPLVFESVVERIYESQSMNRVFVDLGFMTLVAPSVIGLIVALVLQKRSSRRVEKVLVD